MESKTTGLVLLALASLLSCGTASEDTVTMQPDLEQRLAKYTTFRLEADLSALTENQRQMLPLLIDAAKVMDQLFWRQSYGEPATLIQGAHSAAARRFVEINYGPWDRLAGNEPFLEGVGPKPLGANFYPGDMTKEEFEAAAAESPERAEALKSLYTLVRRDESGKLMTISYHEAFAADLATAAGKLRQAARLADDPGLKHYLELRAAALVSDDYQPSDLAWLDMKDNTVDVVIGPIETYEDRLFGYKAAYEAYVLIKDKEWSQRLAKYTTLLGELQKNLPVADKYKQENPGTESDLNAYEAVYYAGDCNSGSKTIAINLPNDEEVQLKKGTRRLQLKNSMRAKFDKILVPIGNVLIAEDQRRHISFDAFFANTMFHEVAHGLGIKNTLTGNGTVREALRDNASALEEGKADILGLFMVTWLRNRGELGDTDLMDNYVTFLTGIFRSTRFGTSSAHGNANLLRFNYFEKAGAFSRDAESGTYRVEFEKMREAVDSLSENILRLQGDGDYDAVVQFIGEYGTLDESLQHDLNRVNEAGIPVDVVFEQGLGW